jgi:hypothetical protein
VVELVKIQPLATPRLDSKLVPQFAAQQMKKSLEFVLVGPLEPLEIASEPAPEFKLVFQLAAR